MPALEVEYGDSTKLGYKTITRSTNKLEADGPLRLKALDLSLGPDSDRQDNIEDADEPGTMYVASGTNHHALYFHAGISGWIDLVTAGGGGGGGGAGSVGPTGPTGPTGPIGACGLTGLTGLQGACGTLGLDGACGPIGATGSQGMPGTPGNDGVPGAIGACGADGNKRLAHANVYEMVATNSLSPTNAGSFCMHNGSSQVSDP